MNTDNLNLLDALFDKNGEQESNISSVNQITEKIIGCSYSVSNVLGCGFLEKVYENALTHELRKKELKVLQQHPIKVFYDKIVVGEYIADLFVENRVIVEIKALRTLEEAHISQCLNYLKATNIKIGLVINFGK